MTTFVFARGALPAAAAGTRFAVLDPATTTQSRSDVFSVGERLLEASDAIEDTAELWTKSFGRRAQVRGVPLRDTLRWRDTPLWYFAELYLHHSTKVSGFVRLLETFARVLETETADEVRSHGLSPEETVLLSRLCAARGVDFDGEVPAPPQPPSNAEATGRWNAIKTALSSLKRAAGGGPPAREHDPSRTAVLFLSHAAFWTDGSADGTGEAKEHYFGELIPALSSDPSLDCVVVAVGPEAAHRRRTTRSRVLDWLRPAAKSSAYVPVNRFTTARVVRETTRATEEIKKVYDGLRNDVSLAEALSHREVRFDDLAAEDLAATMLLQLPWAVRSMEETTEILEWAKPKVLVLYAESSGWGRAALAAARERSVKTVAIQHGIVYPHYFSYRHEADEADCPLPDVTAVFGEEAKRLLMQMGRYPEDRLVVTGSPKFDALLERSRRLKPELIRRSLGLAEGDALVVVASRFRPIRETHQAIGAAFPLLVTAVESLADVAALVKPHPAEPADPYEAVLKQMASRSVAVVASKADLGELLVASDALVTVESLSAVEALVLGRPVVVLNMPTNLRSLVESGAAWGVYRGDDVRSALEKVLFDSNIRWGLERARLRYLDQVACGVDGRATERLLKLIRQTALSSGVVPS